MTGFDKHIMLVHHWILGRRRPNARSRGVLTVAIAGLLLVASSGCDFLGWTGPSRGEVEHEIVFTLSERHVIGEERAHEPRLTFSMATEYDMPCSNYDIRYELDRSRNRLSIRVLEIVRPGVCLTALGPARAS